MTRTLLLVVLLIPYASLAQQYALQATWTATPARPTRTPTFTRTPQFCPGDVDHDGEVRVDEVIQAINALLSGCPQ